MDNDLTDGTACIVLDAAGWAQRSDFFDAILPRLGPPAWHGANLDAMWDSLLAGHYRLKPPFEVVIRNLNAVPPDLREYLSRFERLMADAAAHGLAVTLTMVD